MTANETGPGLDPQMKVTIVDAAMITGRSRATIKRRRDKGRFPNSEQVGSLGTWLIPISDLVAAGLLAPDQVATALDLVEQAREATQIDALREALATTRVENGALAEKLDRADREIAWLRGQVERLTVVATTRRAA